MVGGPIGPRSWSGFQPLRLSSRLIVAGERRNTRAISRVLLFSCFIAKIAPRSSAPRCSYFCPMQHILNEVLHLTLETARQKKAAHTASPCSYPRALNVPTLHTAVPWLVLVANASNERLTRFECPY